MLPISTQARFFLYSEAVDMRKSFDGLQGIINNSLKMNPHSGDVFILINRRQILPTSMIDHNLEFM